MRKKYIQAPKNWSKIIKKVIYDKKRCVEEIVKAKKCLILDTCVIMQYENLDYSSSFFRYIRDQYDVILITRTILMELESDDGNLSINHISFLNRLSLEKDVFIFDEEWCYDYLKLAFSKTDKELNMILSEIIKITKKLFNNCVDNFMNDSYQVNKYIKNIPTTEFFTDFFTDIRSKKESEDSLGEELIAMIVLLMANIMDLNSCKFELLSNDRKSYPSLLSVKSYIKSKCMWDALICRTTCNLAQILYKNNYMSKNDLKDFMSVSYHQSNFKCYCAGKNDLKCEEYSFTIDSFIDIIGSDNLFRVMY